MADEQVPEPLPIEEARELAQYDLTSRMTPFLDVHLIFPIFHFLQEVGIYKEEHITRAMLQLLDKTKMIDYAAEKYTALGEEEPPHLEERRAEVLGQLEGSRDRVMTLLQLLEDEDKVRRISAIKSLQELCDEFDLQPSCVDNLVYHAKLQYDCGNYSLSGELLKHCRMILANTVPEGDRPVTVEVSCMWGALASFILNLRFDENSNGIERAADVIFQLDDSLEKSKTLSKREVLLQRTWLLHWTLFAIFAPEKLEAAPERGLRGDREAQEERQRVEEERRRVQMKLLDFFLNDKSLSIISLSAPHLFRYVGACLIWQKRLKHVVKDTVWIIQHESNSYSDPITRFLLALYTRLDFEEAQHELQKCALLCKADYFLSRHWVEFEENARLLIFETYCRIHQCINIKMIASRLNMEAEEAELWIVKLIQNAKLDARIDSEKSRVVMSKAPPSVYQQVLEKTKNLSFRSTMLLSNLEKRERERQSAA